MMIKNLNSLGVFGSASLNSVEIALITSDGIDISQIIKTSVVHYPENLALKIRALINQRNRSFAELENNIEVQKVRKEVSDFYVEVIKEFLNENQADIIGVDGLTVFCDAENRCSYQIEDGSNIADGLQRQIITHFHKADLLCCGQAAPLSPTFFNYLGQKIEKPALFIDLETVCSLIYVNETGELLAFDCAPCLAMIEDWTFRHANMQTDYNGKLAITGKVHKQIVETMLHHKILRKRPPKALDILCFSDKKEHLEGLTLEDGAATATNFIAEAIYQAALNFLPAIPHNIFLAGEGTKNPSLVRFIKQCFAPRNLQNITCFNTGFEHVGAIYTAFNAIRRTYGLPITFPSTTGVAEPLTGGEFYENKRK